jgi:hypothetical protein
MIDFLSHYPIDHYIKTLIKPNTNHTKVGFFLSRDYDQMLIKEKKSLLYWNPNLRDIAGAPSLETTQPKKNDDRSFLIPSSYRRGTIKTHNINKNNETFVLLDDPEMVIAAITISSHETAEELETALSRDPSSIITAWKNYNHTSEFSWEILNNRCEIVRNKMRLTKKVIVCGFPEQRAIHTAQWFQSHNQELSGLVPLIPSILRWGLHHCPTTGCFLLINTPYEIAISYLENGEIKVISTQKTREGFTADEVSDVQELVEELGVEKKDAQIWCWDILSGSNAFLKLKAKYPNTLSLSPENLNEIEPLTAKKEESPLKQSKEAWLLNHILS